jgi:mannitol-1-phosphate 5-dehydrogenase
VQDSIIDQLNAKDSYDVIQVGTEGEQRSSVRNYRAINSRINEAALIKEITTADVVTCSVGPNVLKFIAPVIAQGIDRRASGLRPLSVIACENAIGATDTLAEFIKKGVSPYRILDLGNRARFANSAIDRIVPAQDPNAGLDVKLEKFSEWVVDRTPFAPYAPPDIKGIKLPPRTTGTTTRSRLSSTPCRIPAS